MVDSKIIFKRILDPDDTSQGDLKDSPDIFENNFVTEQKKSQNILGRGVGWALINIFLEIFSRS